jgi:hypothetical protein
MRVALPYGCIVVFPSLYVAHLPVSGDALDAASAYAEKCAQTLCRQTHQTPARVHDAALIKGRFAIARRIP